MAVGHRLPNGYVCILLTPREATLHRDQILDPEGFPWLQPTESQMVALEIRQILTDAVVHDSLNRLNEATGELMAMAKAKEQKAKGYWQCGCGYVNGREHEFCEECTSQNPLMAGAEEMEEE